jgi:hypothetical protein
MKRFLFALAILLTFTVSANAEPISFEHRVGYSAGEISQNYYEFYYGENSATLTSAVALYSGTLTTNAVPNLLSAASAAIKLSSSDANDTGELTLVYLDSNWDRQEVTETLTGQTAVTLSVTAIRVLSATYDWSGAQDKTNQGAIYVYTGAATSGVPDDLSTVICAIPAGRGRTQAVASIPRNVARAVITDVFVNDKVFTAATTEVTGMQANVKLVVQDSSQTYPIRHIYGPFPVGKTEVMIPVDDKYDIFLIDGGNAVQGAAATVGGGFHVYYRKQ